MAVTITKRIIERVGKRFVEFLYGTFSTTDTAGAISTGLSRIVSAQAQYVGTIAVADGSLSVSTASAVVDGDLIVTGGTLNLARVAGTTSGAAFFLRLEGY